MRRSGWMLRSLAVMTVPRMANSRVTAKQSRVPMKVARRTRKGMEYQRGERWGGMGIKGILLGWCSENSQHGSQYEFVLGQAGGFGEDAALASLCWTAEAAVSP